MSLEGWIVVRNWDRFQHPDVLRSERPAWVKTYTDLLADDDFLSLSDRRRGLLVCLWLLYASAHGRLTVDTRRLSGLLCMRVTVADLKALNHAGFIEFSASRPASNRASKVASLDKRREEKKEQELPQDEELGELEVSGETDEPRLENLDQELAVARLLQAIGEANNNGARAHFEQYGLPPAAWFAAAEDLERRGTLVRNRWAYTQRLFQAWKEEGRYV